MDENFNSLKSFRKTSDLYIGLGIHNIEKQLSKCVCNADIIETLAEMQREIMKVVCDIVNMQNLYI